MFLAFVPRAKRVKDHFHLNKNNDHFPNLTIPSSKKSSRLVSGNSWPQILEAVECNLLTVLQ